MHILGLLNIVTAVAAGARIRLHPRFDLDASLRAIEQEHMTLEMAVAPIALGMANHPRLEDFDLSSLRYIMWGATPVAEEVARTVTRRTGVRWLPAYGTSEVPVIAANPVQQSPDEWRLDSAGLPAPGVSIRIADPETGAVLDPGATGEIEVWSPSAMAGYLPGTETAAAFRDGWYRTGDIGWVEPEGWLHITDRLKEMIKVRGFQVAPAEIEAVLHADPRVRDSAVFGVDDAKLGEAVVAAVVVVPDAVVTSEELQGAVAEQLAGYKRIRHVVMVDEIPGSRRARRCGAGSRKSGSPIVRDVSVVGRRGYLRRFFSRILRAFRLIRSNSSFVRFPRRRSRSERRIALDRVALVGHRIVPRLLPRLLRTRPFRESEGLGRQVGALFRSELRHDAPRSRS